MATRNIVDIRNSPMYFVNLRLKSITTTSSGAHVISGTEYRVLNNRLRSKKFSLDNSNLNLEISIFSFRVVYLIIKRILAISLDASKEFSTIFFAE